MAEEKNASVKDVVLEMVNDDSKKCGNTPADGTIPSNGMVKWLGNGGGGFTHVGPCEIYLDDTMMLHDDNYEDEYPGGDVGTTVTSDMPVDYSSCNGDCTLTIYWLAFQNEQWQVYIKCVPLSESSSTTTADGTSGSSAPTGALEASSTEAEADATEAPATASASTESSLTGTQPTETPTITTAAQSTTIHAPSTATPTTVTCNAASHRLRKKSTET
ncbi:hypothetical protein ON010_g7878 [Phytophthora cinnamomi]|nr:hypothetical protein ON010_g7878 [Phytophthora cinnamomi]